MKILLKSHIRIYFQRKTHNFFIKISYNIADTILEKLILENLYIATHNLLLKVFRISCVYLKISFAIYI